MVTLYMYHFTFRCEIKIRLRGSSDGVVKLEFRRLKLGSLNVEGRCAGNAFLRIIDGGEGKGSAQDFGRYCGEAEQGAIHRGRPH